MTTAPMTLVAENNCAQLPIAPGNPLLPGATLTPAGVNFSVFSFHADACSLVLFKQGESEPYTEILFPDEYRTGAVFSMLVGGLNPADLEYGYRMSGPYQPK